MFSFQYRNYAEVELLPLFDHFPFASSFVSHVHFFLNLNEKMARKGVMSREEILRLLDHDDNEGDADREPVSD